MRSKKAVMGKNWNGLKYHTRWYLGSKKHYTEQSAKETLASVTDTTQILETYIVVCFLAA